MTAIRTLKDKLLYNEVLCERSHGTFKKLRVGLTRSLTEDAGKVYGLDIKGVQHKFDMHLTFSEQDLCFMSLGEIQEDVEASSCFPCFNRNYSPRLIYSQLLLIWYTVAADGSGQCVKIPLVQKGNVHASTALRKLQHVIKNNIITDGDMMHWRVNVVRCGHLYERDVVLLVITKYALVVVYKNNILHHHSYLSCQFAITSRHDSQEVEITITDKSWRDESAHLHNFALTRTYIFKSSHSQQIEKCLKSFQRKSILNPPAPSAHFNIRHSELSASDWFPGSYSDNMALPEVCPYDPVNNNTDSSDSASTSVKIDNTTVLIHPAVNPKPHVLKQAHTSSNGQIPSSGSGSITFEKRRKDPPDSLPLYNPRGNRTSQPDLEILRKPPDSSPPQKILPSPCKIASTDTFPGVSVLHHSTSPQNGPWTLDLDLDPDDTVVKSVFSLEDDLPPPPPPCSNFSIPHVSFNHKPPPKPHLQGSEELLTVPDNIPKLMRSHSFSSVLDEELANHLYINVEQELTARKLIHGDSPYYRFYINTGYIPYTRMVTKLERRSRLSQEMKEVDFNKLENHEKWYDHCFKKRSMDEKFNRLSTRLNIPLDANGSVRPSIRQQVFKPDDPYWSGDLSLTIQTILQEKRATIQLQEIQDSFDVSYEQLVSIQVLLSLVPSENNWRNLAEFIGLENQDVGIIEHFCYTYHELTAKVLFIHWIRQARKGKCMASSFENLKRFLQSIERDDIMNILQTCRENQSVQTPTDVLESTHF